MKIPISSCAPCSSLAQPVLRPLLGTHPSFLSRHPVGDLRSPPLPHLLSPHPVQAACLCDQRPPPTHNSRKLVPPSPGPHDTPEAPPSTVFFLPLPPSPASFPCTRESCPGSEPPQLMSPCFCGGFSGCRQPALSSPCSLDTPATPLPWD